LDKEVESFLVKKYPSILREMNGTNYTNVNQSPLYERGLELPKGWFSVFIELLEELDVYVKKASLKDFYISQVKEKFFYLTVYTEHGDEKTSEIITKYSTLAKDRCLSCGRNITKDAPQEENDYSLNSQLRKANKCLRCRGDE